MGPQFGKCHFHAGTVTCPQCGTAGTVKWEDAESPAGATQFVKVEGDFYERLSKRPPHPIELVCNSCGTTQSSPLQS